MRTAPLFIVTSLLAAASTATPAHAEFETSSSGSACLASGSASVERRSIGSFNGTNDAITFLCPATKHYNSNIQSATAVVVDRRTDAEVDCTLFSLTRRGETLAFSRRGSGVAFANSTAAVLSFAPLASTRQGVHILRCTVPGRTAANEWSGVASYSITEE